MNPQEIDRILGDEEGVEPSPLFRTRVMHAVRRDGVASRTPVFPWSRIWPALALASVVGPLFVLAGLVDGRSLPPDVVDLARWFSAALTATLVLAWYFARLPGRAVR